MTAVTKVSKFSDGTLPTVTANVAGEVICSQAFIDLTAAQVANGNYFDLCPLPAYHRVVDMVLIPDDLDTNGSPTITLDVGLLTGTVGDAVGDRTIGTEFFSGEIGARTGAIARMSLPGGFKVAATEADRSIGLKVSAAVATAAAGRVRVLVFMASSDHKLTF